MKLDPMEEEYQDHIPDEIVHEETLPLSRISSDRDHDNFVIPSLLHELVEQIPQSSLLLVPYLTVRQKYAERRLFGLTLHLSETALLWYGKFLAIGIRALSPDAHDGLDRGDDVLKLHSGHHK